MFEEGIALTECLEWLRDLKFRKLEDDPEGALFHQLMEFVNQGDFLPSNVRLEDVTSRGILFCDANGGCAGQVSRAGRPCEGHVQPVQQEDEPGLRGSARETRGSVRQNTAMHVL